MLFLLVHNVDFNSLFCYFFPFQKSQDGAGLQKQALIGLINSMKIISVIFLRSCKLAINYQPLVKVFVMKVNHLDCINLLSFLSQFLPFTT